ncbi:MAG: hypothetical protein ACRDOK_20475 [Streptosporangiaceae bacterium]
MANQIVLTFAISTAETTLTPAQAATRMAAVPLYTNTITDPVLGQMFGLTVAADTTVAVATGATRTLKLNMTAAVGAPFAPPPFPCRLSGSQAPPPGVPPAPPYVLTKTVVDPLTQLASVPKITTVPAPAKLAAIYSTSDLDTAGVAIIPPIPAGAGAQSVSLSYLDSTGAGPFTVVTPLRGKFPSTVVLAVGSIDIATITDLHIVAVGGFDNSIGQITLAEVPSPVPPIPTNRDDVAFLILQDQAQGMLLRPLVYLPPSYFAVTRQGASLPQLSGNFFVTTGSASVPTSGDQTGVLAPGNQIQFASQMTPGSSFATTPVLYTIASVTPKIVVITTPYSGLDVNKIDSDNDPRPTNPTANAAMQPTGAFLVTPSPSAPPKEEQLEVPLGQFALPQTQLNAVTYGKRVAPFVPGETVRGERSGARATIAFDNAGTGDGAGTGTLAFVANSLVIGFFAGELLDGSVSGPANATVDNPHTQTTSPVPMVLSGLFAQALSLALSAPVVSQPITLV